jgi:hypothetical protein
MLRTIFAFLLAPVPAASAMAVLVAVRPGGRGLGIFVHPASMFASICLLSYILGLLLGVPLFLWLRRWDPVSLRTFAFTGALVSVISAALLAVRAVTTGNDVSRATILGLSVYVAIGLLTGASFWFIARPDRRAAMGKSRAGKARLRKTFD